MRKVLFIIQNPFQTMTAILMRVQQFKNCVCDALITDRSSNMDMRAERLRQTGLFRNVYYIHAMQCWNKGAGFQHHVGQAKCYLFGCNQKELDEIPLDYDEVLTLLLNCVINELVTRMHQRGQNPEISLVEEGFSCYTDTYRNAVFGFNNGRPVVEKVGATLRGGVVPSTLVKNIYFYKPEFILWKVPFTIKRIKQPDFKKNTDLKEIINYVFDYNNEASFFEGKITIFEGCEFQDFGFNGDLPVILKIAEKAGTENIIVKLHPRTTENRFIKYGIKTTDILGLKQGVPWEVIVMNMDDESNCSFVTATSGAIINYALLFEKKFRTILLYKCLDGNYPASEKNKFLFFEHIKNDNSGLFVIPERIEDIEQVFAEWYRK